MTSDVSAVAVGAPGGRSSAFLAVPRQKDAPPLAKTHKAMELLRPGAASALTIAGSSGGTDVLLCCPKVTPGSATKADFGTVCGAPCLAFGVLLPL